MWLYVTQFRTYSAFSITQSTNCYIPPIRLILWRNVLRVTRAILFCFNLHSKRHKAWHSAHANHHYQTCYIIKTKKMLAYHVLDGLVSFTRNCKHFLVHLASHRPNSALKYNNTSTLPTRGCSPQNIFWHTQHHPPHTHAYPEQGLC